MSSKITQKLGISSFLSSESEELPNFQDYSNNSQIFDYLLKTVKQSKNQEKVSSCIKQFCSLLAKAPQQQIFLNYFVESKFLDILMSKLRYFSYQSSIIKSVFSSLQFLLKALKVQEQIVYLMISLNKAGFVSQEYSFKEEEDIAYFANFLKLLVRRINQDNKYLAVFFNSTDPHFPLILSLLKFYDCQDLVMHTSAKLSLMQISKNESPMIKKYLVNFPFVLFYPYYVSQISKSLKQTIRKPQSKFNNGVDDIENHLRFMEEFIDGKEKSTVDFYSNSFMYLVGKLIYQQIKKNAQKNNLVIRKLLELISKVIIPELKVKKIRVGVFLLLNSGIRHSLKQFLQEKVQLLQSKYWLTEYCKQEIVEHSKSIFFINNPRKSLYKSFTSFIPKSKDNWLYYELQKIRSIVGFDVVLNEELDADYFVDNSFLGSLEDYNDNLVDNQIFNMLIKTKDEETIFYLLRCLNDLSPQTNEKVSIDKIIFMACNSVSLSLVIQLYLLVLNQKFLIHHEQRINQTLMDTEEKLVFIILENGWFYFISLVQELRLSDQKIFQNDIYRDNQCDILFFVALRNIMGTKNQECDQIDKETEFYQFSPKKAEIRFSCQSQDKQQVLAILQGEYIKIINDYNEKTIKEPTVLETLNCYENGPCVQILSGSENQLKSFYTLRIFSKEKREYFLKEFKQRRQLASKIRLELRTIKFQFENQ